MATVTLTRRGSIGLLRRLKILVDDQTVDSIHIRGSASFTLTPGRHEISVKMDWARSVPLVIAAVGDETIFVEAVAPNLGVGLFRAFLHPSRLFAVRLIATRS